MACPTKGPHATWTVCCRCCSWPRSSERLWKGVLQSTTHSMFILNKCTCDSGSDFCSAAPLVTLSVLIINWKTCLMSYWNNHQTPIKSQRSCASTQVRGTSCCLWTKPTFESVLTQLTRSSMLKSNPLIFLISSLPCSVNEQRDAAEYFEKILTLTSSEASQVNTLSVLKMNTWVSCKVICVFCVFSDLPRRVDA